jgi:hypothetical protein
MPAWSGTIPIYINNFNWFSPVKNLAAFFESIPGTEMTIIDNASTYPPLLEWYDHCRCRVVRLIDNCGPYAPWNMGIITAPEKHRATYCSDYYVVTDPDLSLDECPADMMDLLVQGWHRYPSISKIGLSLEIDDLPLTSPLAEGVKEWESQYWRDRRDDQFFDAAVDTTFAMYHIDVPFGRAKATGNSLRADRPYTARHLPWYIDPAHMSEEEEYYVKTTRAGHWGTALQRLIPGRYCDR